MERDALTDIYHATDGKYWYKKWNWCNAFERYSKWYGVVVDNGGHVQTINLRENFLRGNITSLPRLNCLKNLQVLVLSVNKITGELPCNFHELVSLEQLDLSWNQLTGRIPPTLYACSTLKILKLEHNQLEGEIIEDIQALTELVHLDLSYNRFSGRVPAVASSFPELKMVDFRGNQLEGPSPWLVKDFLALDDLPVIDGETKQFEEDVVEDTAND